MAQVRIKLIKSYRTWKAGEVLDVSHLKANDLIRYGVAESAVTKAPTKPKKDKMMRRRNVKTK